jgi:hypothetical protein
MFILGQLRSGQAETSGCGWQCDGCDPLFETAEDAEGQDWRFEDRPLEFDPQRNGGSSHPGIKKETFFFLIAIVHVPVLYTGRGVSRELEIESRNDVPHKCDQSSCFASGCEPHPMSQIDGKSGSDQQVNPDWAQFDLLLE